MIVLEVAYLLTLLSMGLGKYFLMKTKNNKDFNALEDSNKNLKDYGEDYLNDYQSYYGLNKDYSSKEEVSKATKPP